MPCRRSIGHTVQFTSSLLSFSIRTWGRERQHYSTPTIARYVGPIYSLNWFRYFPNCWGWLGQSETHTRPFTRATHFHPLNFLLSSRKPHLKCFFLWRADQCHSATIQSNILAPLRQQRDNYWGGGGKPVHLSYTHILKTFKCFQGSSVYSSGGFGWKTFSFFPLPFCACCCGERERAGWRS